MKIRIYDKKMKNVIKTYEAPLGRVRYGIVQEIARIFDVGKISSMDREAVAAHTIKHIPLYINDINEVILGTFEEMTEEELEYADNEDIKAVGIELSQYALGNIFSIANDNKGKN